MFWNMAARFSDNSSDKIALVTIMSNSGKGYYCSEVLGCPVVPQDNMQAGSYAISFNWWRN